MPMNRPRFSIAGLLAAVLLAAIAVAALRESTDLWDGAVFGLTLAVLLVAVLLAIYAPRPRRACWLGFALVGSVYLSLSLIPAVERRLPTTHLLILLDLQLPDRSPDRARGTLGLLRPGYLDEQVVAFSPDGRGLAPGWHDSVKLWDAQTGRLVGGLSKTSVNFVRIGHSIMALILGFAGGQLARHLAARRDAQYDSAATNFRGSPPVRSD
jgi:hypothetical protein